MTGAYKIQLHIENYEWLIHSKHRKAYFHTMQSVLKVNSDARSNRINSAKNKKKLKISNTKQKDAFYTLSQIAERGEAWWETKCSCSSLALCLGLRSSMVQRQVKRQELVQTFFLVLGKYNPRTLLTLPLRSQ